MMKKDIPRCRQDSSMLCDDTCVYKRVLAAIGKKHTLDILRVLSYDRTVRFNALQNEIRGSPKTLTDRLNELCSLGIIKRNAFAEIPPRVEYSLTEKGLDLTPVMDALRDWALKWAPLG